MDVKELGMSQGRWIKVSGDQATDDEVMFKCSECGAITSWRKDAKSIYPGEFCFNCYADMRARRTATTD